MIGVGGGALSAVFVAMGLLFVGVGVGMPVLVWRRTGQARSALQHGLTAEGRVLDTYVTHRENSGSQRHAVIGFRAADGREYRLDETGGRPRVIGDHVPVRYRAERPDRGVAADTGMGSMAVGGVIATVVGVLFAGAGAFFALLGAGGLWFISSN